MDLKILETVNKLLKKKGKKMEYIALTEMNRGAISPSVKIYHVTLYKMVYGEFMSKHLIETFNTGGVLDEKTAENVLNEMLTEYFLTNGI